MNYHHSPRTRVCVRESLRVMNLREIKNTVNENPNRREIDEKFDKHNLLLCIINDTEKCIL